MPKTIQCGKGQSFQQIMLGKLDIYMQNYEVGFFNIVYKTQNK
jgi:hypothetical protein